MSDLIEMATLRPILEAEYHKLKNWNTITQKTNDQRTSQKSALQQTSKIGFKNIKQWGIKYFPRKE